MAAGKPTRAKTLVYKRRRPACSRAHDTTRDAIGPISGRRGEGVVVPWQRRDLPPGAEYSHAEIAVTNGVPGRPDWR